MFVASRYRLGLGVVYYYSKSGELSPNFDEAYVFSFRPSIFDLPSGYLIEEYQHAFARDHREKLGGNEVKL